MTTNDRIEAQNPYPQKDHRAEHIAQVIAAWNMKQQRDFCSQSSPSDMAGHHRMGRLCIHQIRELAEVVQAELAKKEEA